MPKISISRIFIFAVALAIVFPTNLTWAFFWSSQETPTPPPHYFYHQRLLHSPNGYAVAAPPVAGGAGGGTGGGDQQQPVPVPVPSIPVQMPIKAQLAPAATLQNVQLVPCLCPVSQDFDFDKSQQDTVYFSPAIPNNNINKNN